MIPDDRLYTIQMSRRDLGLILNGLERYLEDYPKSIIQTEVRALAVWLSQVYEGAPDDPAYFWLGEEGERITL